MKKILVLTDLSDNTQHLTRAAVKFAINFQADILLFKTYQSIPVTTFYGAGPWIGEDETWWEQESKDKLDKMGIELQQFIHLSFPGEKWRPVVYSRCEEGNLADNLKNVFEHDDIEMVIMGSSSEGSFEHLLFGNKTKSVLAHAKRPVLIITVGTELADISKVVFATDFNISDIKAVKYLANLGEILHYDLEIVHVDVFGDNHQAETEARKVFLEILECIKYPNLHLQEIHGKEVVKSLKQLCARQGANILGLLHHQDSLVVRMIRQSITTDLLGEQTIPVIVFPSKMMLP